MLHGYSPVLLISLSGRKCVEHHRGNSRKAQTDVEMDTKPQPAIKKCHLKKKGGHHLNEN